MIDAIYVAMTGLNGYEKGLRVISNDTANLNTPGFKGSTLQFADMFYSNGNLNGGNAQTFGQYGAGLTTLGSVLNFQQGQLQNTGNDLDLAIDGLGLFTLKGSDNVLRYTRDGQFKFNSDGVLVSATTGEEVMARDSNGAVGPISVANLGTNPAKSTATVTFSGNLSSTATTDTIENVKVIDKAGTSHALSVKLDAESSTPGTWDVTVLDGSTTVGTGKIAFIDGLPDLANSKVAVTYTPPGESAMSLSLDFSNNVTSFDSGSQSTIAMGSQDGYVPGNLTAATFDATGTLQLTYSNGQVVKGSRLVLSRFNSPDAVESVGNNEFEVKDGLSWQIGVAGEDGFGNVRPGMVESSNVDLSQEFSNLVIMQRGYQASSQVISTANDMLTQLFDMRSK